MASFRGVDQHRMLLHRWASDRSDTWLQIQARRPGHMDWDADRLSGANSGSALCHLQDQLAERGN